MGAKPLTVVALRDALGVSFQAADKIRKGGGLGPKNLLKAAEKFKVRPEWLSTGKGKKFPDAPSPPPAPAPRGLFFVCLQRRPSPAFNRGCV